MTVIVTAAASDQEPVLQNLLQLYTHDFSEFWANTTKGNLQANGRFADYPLQPYWVNPKWSAWMIWSNEVLAGFALINDHAHSDKHVDRNVGEFFILRKHRDRGIGRIAAEILFSQHPGTWEVAVARKNVQALSFWRRTISGAVKAANVSEMDLNNEQWNGPILRFDWRS
jgi:predicted acetyltransferase